MNRKKNLDGFIPRRTPQNQGGYNAPLTGAPSQLGTQQNTTKKLSRKQKKVLRHSSDTSWQNPALKNSVLSSANPSEPLSSSPLDLSDKNITDKKQSKHPRLKKALKLSLIPLLLIGSFYLWNLFSLSGKIFGGNPLGFLKSTTLKGEDKGRVNILLAGTSEGDPNHPGEDLTDSIMIISYTVATKKTALISIPRDLYVKNKYASTKINALYHYGEEAKFDESGYFKGGMGALQKELEGVTGLDINYYAKINYNAFKEAVDAVGGIEIDIQGTDKRGIYDPNFDGEFGKDALRLKNGKQTLSGTQALLLSRARNANGGYGLAGSDYDRAANQRKMLVALKDKALNINIFANPLKLNKLTDAIGDNIATDMNTSEARRIYELAGDPESKVESVGLTSENVLKNYTSRGTGAALIPKEGIGEYDEVQKFISEQVGPLQKDPGSSSSNQTAEEYPPAEVVVLNAGGATGTAQAVADKLPQNIKPILVSDTSEKVSGTKVVVISKDKDAAKNKLIKSYSATLYDGSSKTYLKLYPNADFVILVGKS